MDPAPSPNPVYQTTLDFEQLLPQLIALLILLLQILSTQKASFHSNYKVRNGIIS